MLPCSFSPLSVLPQRMLGPNTIAMFCTVILFTSARCGTSAREAVPHHHTSAMPPKKRHRNRSVTKCGRGSASARFWRREPSTERVTGQP